MLKLYQNQSWLEAKYHGEKLSSHKIATICTCNQKAIMYWLKKFGIKTRTLSEALREGYLQKTTREN